MQQAKSIIMVGSGAGVWTLAAWLAELMRPANISLTVVELAEPSVLAEFSGSSLGRFNEIIGLPEKQLIQSSNSTFSYGVCYEDWPALGRNFMLSEAGVGDSYKGVPFTGIFARARELGLDATYDNYSLAASAALQNKFAHPPSSAQGIFSTLNYGLNLDIKGYAALLQAKAEAAGVVRIQSNVTHLQRDTQRGYITQVQLQDGRQLACDLLLDCTLDGQLIRGQLKASESTNQALPVFNAALVGARSLAQLAAPYGRIKATAAGIIRAIPLKERMIYHYSYTANSASDASVMDELAALDAELIHALPNVGGNYVLSQFWEKNYIAMGAAAYQLPRLHQGLLPQLRNEVARLGDLLMSFNDLEILAQEYNRLTHLEYSERGELSELQLYMAGTRIEPLKAFYAKQGLSEGARHRYQLFASHGRLGTMNTSLMSEAERKALFLGNDILPAARDPHLAALSDEELLRFCRHVVQMTAMAVDKLPSHGEYLQRLMTL